LSCLRLVNGTLEQEYKNSINANATKTTPDLKNADDLISNIFLANIDFSLFSVLNNTTVKIELKNLI
jgi:hypothetical protein